MIKAILIQPLFNTNNAEDQFPRCLLPDVDLVAKVHSVADGIEMVRKVRPNLVILDVDMPGDSPFRVFEETADVFYEKIILSEQARHAVKAARYQVADYLLKPLREEDFRGAVDRLLFSQGKMMIQQLYKNICCKHQQMRLAEIFLHSPDRKRIVLQVDSIIRVQEAGKFLQVFTTDRGVFTVQKGLKKLANILVYNDFFLCDKHLISLKHIQSLEEGSENMMANMEDGFQVPISLSREHSLRRRLNLPPGKGLVY